MIRAVGLVIYTYKALENYVDPIWEWIHDIELWYGERFSVMYFSSRNELIGNYWNFTPRKRNELYKQVNNKVPWTQIAFGLSKDNLSKSVAESDNGLVVTVRSSPQPSRGGEAYRFPSHVSIEVTPQIFNANQKVVDFINFGSKAWSMIGGEYGYIDVDTGIPPNDSFSRNFECIVSNLIPPEYFEEFKEWRTTMPLLNKRIWKTFWGNYFGHNHLEQLGGYAELRRLDLFRPQDEIEKESHSIGMKILQSKINILTELENGGYFFKLTESPLSWNNPETQNKKRELQETLTPISIRNYSL